MRVRQAKRIGKAALIAGGTAAAIYVGSSVAIAWLLVRPSRRLRYDSVPRIRHGRLEAVELTSADGVKLHAWLLLSELAPPERWVVVLHGYRSDRIASHRRARFFARRGYNVLLLHFRGHGGSQRETVSYGYRERLDVVEAFRFLNLLPLKKRVRIGIDGRSMGAAAAALAVGNGEIDPDWMILESCYDNIQNALLNRLQLRIGKSFAPLVAWPVGLLVEQLADLRAEDLDPAKALEKARCPVLVLAGDSEKVLKIAEIEYLYGCVPEPKRLAIFPGAGHDDLLAYDPRRFIRVVDGFLEDYSHGASDTLATEAS